MTRILTVIAVVLAFARAGDAGVVLVRDGQPRAAILVSEAVMAPDRGEPPPWMQGMDAESQRRRLRESVKDLAHYLEKMSGATVPIVTDENAKPDAGEVPIYIGERAAAVFGPVGKTYEFKQAFRVVVADRESELPGVGLFGESDLATSYAIYELLDRLGCRWYMPSELGEVIPKRKTIELDELDFASAPGTYCRDLWYADADYERRNRFGGLKLASGDALEHLITEEQRQAHPEWRATVDGKPQPLRLKWSNPAVADAAAEAVIKYLDQYKTPTVSLSPLDGLGFDNSPEDRALDAGDMDETLGEVAITDRLMVLMNRIIPRVTAKHPDVRFGLLAYANYLRPPIREKVHPNLVPHIAPITYSRAHPMNDDRVPGNKQLRYAVEGWAKRTDATAYWFYGWFLAEPVAPNPMLTKWGHDVPYVLAKGNCKYWQPETQANFDTSMHALYMSCRVAFNPKLKPADIYRELNEKFYGHAAKEMTAYWEFIDRVWIDTPEYAGCGFGHLRRWTPGRLEEARAMMNKALAAATTDEEKFRVGLASDSLGLFEAFMKLRYDQAEGRFDGLAAGAEAWKKRAWVLAEKYKAQSTFTYMNYGSAQVLTDGYMAWFYEPTYKDASRIARDYTILTPRPLRAWKWIKDAPKQGEALGYARADFDDSAWKITDPCVDTWSALGMHDYFGSAWYRTRVNVPAVPPGKNVYLWIASTDGSAKVFVNGTHVPYVAATETKPEANGYCNPFSFDITETIRPGSENQITLLCTRNAVNELGTGGLLGPVVIYREKD